MRKLRTFIIISSLLVATISLAEDRLVLTDKSYGLVTFGSKLKAIEKKVGEKAKGKTGEKGCDFVTFIKYPGIKFMVEAGIVTRADALSPKIENQLHVKMGTSMAEVQRGYPHINVKSHQYDPTGHYLILQSKDRKRAIVFEEGDGQVTDVRVGLEPSVEYVEGCL